MTGQIKQEHRDGLSDKAVIEQICTLLRKILISYRGRDGNAASTGDSWLTQLVSLTGSKNFSQEQLDLLAFSRYKADPDCDISALIITCESWIKALPRGRHVSD